MSEEKNHPLSHTCERCRTPSDIYTDDEEYDEAWNSSENPDFKLTPLMEAARSGDLVEVLKLADENNINDITPVGGDTAISLAARGGHELIVKYLLKMGAYKEFGHQLPLGAAALEGHYEVMLILVENGALIDALGVNGDTALSLACERGQMVAAVYLLIKNAEVNATNFRGHTPLMKACRFGHLQIVKLLLCMGAYVNVCSFDNDATPLSLACMWGHVAIVKKLLEKGANINHRLRDNRTMLMETTRMGHTDVARVLLDFLEAAALKKSKK